MGARNLLSRSRAPCLTSTTRKYKKQQSGISDVHGIGSGFGVNITRNLDLTPPLCRGWERVGLRSSCLTLGEKWFPAWVGARFLVDFLRIPLAVLSLRARITWHHYLGNGPRRDPSRIKSALHKHPTTADWGVFLGHSAGVETRTGGTKLSLVYQKRRRAIYQLLRNGEIERGKDDET